MQYTVYYQGRLIKMFVEKNKANEFMTKFLECQMLIRQQLDYVDAAVLKSDMRESKEVLQHIMDKN